MSSESLVPVKVNLGCGLTTPEGWINIDGSWNARMSRYPLIRTFLRSIRVISSQQASVAWTSNIRFHNLVAPLPFADGSVDCIYASHVLEHLYHDEARRLLAECLRVLRPHGMIRLVVPDLRAIVLEYLGRGTVGGNTHADGSATEPPADRLNRRLMVRTESRPGGGILHRSYTALYDFHSHKWMYDGESLAVLLQTLGFVEVEEKRLWESRIPQIRDVEQEGRVLNGTGVCIEAVRP